MKLNTEILFRSTGKKTVKYSTNYLGEALVECVIVSILNLLRAS